MAVSNCQWGFIGASFSKPHTGMFDVARHYWFQMYVVILYIRHCTSLM